MLPHARAARLLLLLITLCASPAGAQRITGIVRDTASRGSLSGAVVSTLDGQSQTLARTITDAAGRYSLERPASATHLRIVRIGFQPQVIALPQSMGTLQSLDVTMTKLVTLLSTVVVRDDRMCSSDQNRPAALSFWEQARTGLLASIVAREAKPAAATLITYERQIDLSRERVIKQTARKVSGRTNRPFLTQATPSLLVQRGYVEERNGVYSFDAPDADILLDESFAETHCFSIRDADAAHAGAIGVAFEPRRDRDRLVDVKGTLWLEVGVPALRSIDFSFTGGDAATILGDAAGAIHFRTMNNGVVFVDEWHVRTPVMVQTRDPGRQQRIGRSSATASDIVDTRPGRQASDNGGIVSSASWPDGEQWSSPLKPLAGTVVIRGTSAPFEGALVTIDATGDSVLTDIAGRWAIFPVFPGRYDLVVADTALAAFISPRVTRAEVTITPTVQEDLRLGLPGRGEAMRAHCGSQMPANTSILLGRIVDNSGSARVPSGLRVSGSWLGSVTIMNAGVRWRDDGESIDVDDKGRFSLCAVPRERAFQLALHRFSNRVTDTLVTIGPRTEVQQVTWRVDAGAPGAAVAKGPGRLQGQVKEDDNAKPLGDVDVWLPSLDRRTRTDGSGAFAFDSIPPGYQVLSIRYPGFSSRIDTLRFTAGQTTTRAYVLKPQATLLGGVSTVAAAVNYKSPGLRGFESRRATRVAGFFIPESELRVHESEQLVNAIVSRVPGLRQVSSDNGGPYLASSVRRCKENTLGRTDRCSPCYVTTYIDGVLSYNADNYNDRTERTEPTDFGRLSVRDLAGVEFYPRDGTAPSPYTASRLGCGTIMVWTRER
ncbi:MAG: carboxypeptidase regulatory-like domain-containing protein [Gemmatimonadaceae bacterium]